MKTLKLDHELAQAALTGKEINVWRLNDDKYLSVNDNVQVIDKVNPDDKNSWKVIGQATIDTVVEKRLKDLNDNDWIGHTRFGSDEIMYQTFATRYGSNIGPLTPVRIMYFSLKPPTKETVIPANTVSITTVKLFADGGSRGNPGPSASGFVLIDNNGTVVHKSGEYLGITTNNQAEYQALKFGLEEAKRLGIREVAVHMDSLLVVNQMKGVFKVKNRDLWPIHESIKELVSSFKKVTYTHVPRELNKLADSQVNEVLDAARDKSVV